jgi:hypothetical protein
MHDRSAVATRVIGFGKRDRFLVVWARVERYHFKTTAALLTNDSGGTVFMGDLDRETS